MMGMYGSRMCGSRFRSILSTLANISVGLRVVSEKAKLKYADIQAMSCGRYWRYKTALIARNKPRYLRPETM